MRKLLLHISFHLPLSKMTNRFHTVSSEAVFVCANRPLLADNSQSSDLARLDGLIVSCRAKAAGQQL